MEELIKLKEYPVRDFLKKLLQDKTTKLNIKFATSTYESYGYSEESQMTEGALLGFSSCDIQPRVYKSMEDQGDRTRKKAEVFTPAWVVNKMNNHCDSEWFERTNVFNIEEETIWVETTEKIEFPKDKTWKDYIDSRRLEITCGEAPFIVSRYDSTTGEIIPIEKRIGLLDRKLRVVNENAIDENEWLDWVFRAFQSVYGYEFQGDNLLLARVNLLTTFCDYLKAKWNREATKSELTKIINIICWNFWQMDGLEKVVPFGKPQEEYRQLSLFGDDEPEEDEIDEDCLVYDWKQNHSKLFKDIEKRGNNMKFDFVIGNPPYQEATDSYNRQEPIYPLFYDAAEQLSEKYILISPARFLFNAGLTPKEWNKKMLSDAHLKVKYYNQNSNEVFTNTDIKGGIVILYRDSNKLFGAINEFIADSNIRAIASHFSKNEEQNLPSIMYGGRSDLKFNDTFLKKYPNSPIDRLKAIQKKHPNVVELGTNEEYEIKSSTFEVLPYVFVEEEPIQKEKYYKLFGLYSGKRVYRWIEKEYLTPRYPNNNNISGYKVYIPKASGNGIYGEKISEPVIAYPNESSTPTFIGIGNFKTYCEAENLTKYIKSKFTRSLLGILKITQDIVPSKWAYVPLQDFTSNSDIDWSVSIAEIDKQLYKKYGLSTEEIDFIETNVKEME